MTMHRKADHEAWLNELVAAGRYAAADEAVMPAIDHMCINAAVGDDDTEWVRPYLAEGEAPIARGSSMSEADDFAELNEQETARSHR